MFLTKPKANKQINKQTHLTHFTAAMEQEFIHKTKQNKSKQNFCVCVILSIQ